MSSIATKIHANDISNISAIVGISVCGNGILEGGEDCEKIVNKSCKDLGYLSGQLKCDISCSFDTSNCLKEEVKADQDTQIVTTDIPSYLESFDENSDGVITKQEFCTRLVTWITEWKTILLGQHKYTSTVSKLTCDANSDGECNLVDLSIILSKAE